MSNIYIQEPPALGKVLLKTSVGEIDVELWTKEAPKACRNFIQLCMEGYYNGTIFHRVVPGFIVQGGDPNGDGTGGESIYGEPFKDEFHSRLRFNRRGLVAMANAGKDDNGSQFFFTLGSTPELQNKHTIFGKVTGETIYNMLKLAEGLIGPDERPDHPHKITSTTVLINPFTDIVPRVTAVKIEEPPKKKKKERVGVKNFGLLSFGEEAEQDEDEAQEYRGKPKSTHDLLEDPKLSKKTAAELELEEESMKEEISNKDVEKKKEETVAAVNNIRDKLSSKKRGKSPDNESNKRKKEDSDKESSAEEEYYLGKERDMERLKERDRIRNEIRQLKKEIKDTKEDKNKVEELKEDKKTEKSIEDNEMYKKFVEEQEKYKKIKEKIPKKGAARSRRTKFTRKTTRKKPWVKNLYENRDYPDNYTDRKFLEELRKNLFIEKVTLKQAVQGSFRVVLRLCLCVMYAVLYVYMYNNWIHTYTVIKSSVAVSSACYILYVFYEGSDLVRHFKTVLVYLVIGYILSPILHTLTDTVSTDTIYAWAVIMLLVHLIFFDYDVPAALVSQSLSINAAIFASVCLVSRLSTPFDAFILLTVSVIFFVLSPQLFQVFLHTRLFLVLFSVVLFLTLVGLYTVSITILCYFVMLVVVISVYCPIAFVRWQKYKDNKYGPWDEAVIEDCDDLDDSLCS
ncbi:PREDICTED: peptidyl-prolyl cis-trans isomerase CWC27 homolog isoform X1 [Papilio polytes]|uniref:peptidyl-prolyl cis-trans isomerase CWC27 homolog isoform X1 n=1 Tax=Papilio polytes TaxID=76194 RepID=UPI000676740F|nr:PREDICTED: peptidyl-prolyl cis-trans isomerase CWC27 homolog isoform X1 [Papilio polytes]